MRFVFAMDPLDRVHPEKDTTYGFIEAALARGHECLHARLGDIDHVGGDVAAIVRALAMTRGATSGPAPLELVGAAERIALRDVDAVLIRKDPPFDLAYSYATLLLELLRGRTPVINDPRGLRDANEKLYALNFARWMPRTMVSADRAAIHDFVRQVGGRAVIKPLDRMGGYGVLMLKDGDSNARGIVDLLTEEGTELAMVQEFVPEVTEGDKRVLLLDGEPFGAILRVPQGGDLRANIHVGGKVVPTELSAHERELCADIAPRLRADGLFFVGLDLIGGKLTEVNVTSPTGIRELSRFTGVRESDRVIEWVERRVTARAG
jgi:glutathione synthase